MGMIINFMFHCFGFAYLISAIFCIPTFLINTLKKGKLKYIKYATIMFFFNIIIGILLIKAGPFQPECDSYSFVINTLEAMALGVFILFGSALLDIPVSKLD